MIYSSVHQLVGNTPLMELRALQEHLKLDATVLAKLECFNPGGSAKDRVGLSMIHAAQKQGLLKEGSVIIEPTSGNTGIGLACMAASMGYKTMIVMPDSMSVERQKLMVAYGAQLVLTPGKLGMQGAIDKAKELAAQIPGSFIPDQFGNAANPQAHYETTGPEIWADTQGRIDAFVAGVGTGGTVSGVGKYLKEQNKDISVVAVEPAASALLSGGQAGPHGLMGIGANFIPEILDRSVIDRIVTVTEQQAYETARLLGKTEGLLVGISSGAALYAALELAKDPAYEGKTIVTLLPDTGERYLSTPIFE